MIAKIVLFCVFMALANSLEKNDECRPHSLDSGVCVETKTAFCYQSREIN